MRMRLLFCTLAAAAAAIVSVPAGAADKPAPCAGYTLTDKLGDQAFDATGLGLSSTKAQDNADITGLFFNFQGGKLTANIEIAKLDKTLPSPSDAQGGIWYYVVWSYQDQVHFVRAANRDGSTIDYASGTIDTDTGVYKTDPGAVTGAFYEGDKGVISIEVPAGVGGAAGQTLGLASATADYIQGADDQAGINNHVDTTPDSYTSAPNGKNYKVAECGTGGGPTGPSGPTGPTGPTGGTDTSLPFRAANTIGKAKKAKKGKTLKVKVRSTKPITKLSVTLKKSNGKGKALATGKLKSLNGVGKLKLKLRKKLKKGRYLLLATGTVDGTKRSAHQPVLIK
jgi:hypothetical protein